MAFFVWGSSVGERRRQSDRARVTEVAPGAQLLPRTSTLIDAIEDPTCVFSARGIARKDKEQTTRVVSRCRPLRVLHHHAPAARPSLPLAYFMWSMRSCSFAPPTTNTNTTANLTITTSESDSDNGITATIMTTAINVVNTAKHEGV